jgi:ATP-dependent exoDNAse (exonuclease V) alpha subunit
MRAVDAAAVCRRLNTALDIMTVKGLTALPCAPSGRAAKRLAESTGLEARTEVFRQAASSRFVRSAHQINRGVFPSLPAKGEDSGFYLVGAEEPEAIAQTRLPRKFNVDPVRDIQVLCPMNRGITGAGGINATLQAVLNPPGEHSAPHYLMRKRNLMYTGITRGRKLVVLVGQKRGLAMAVKGQQTERRWSKLTERLRTSPFGFGMNDHGIHTFPAW